MSTRLTPVWTHLSNSPASYASTPASTLPSGPSCSPSARVVRSSNGSSASRSGMRMPSSESTTENRPTVKPRSGSAPVGARGDELAQARAQQARLEQVARAVVDAREREQRGPAADGRGAERHQRLLDRADRVAAAVEGGVRELDELEREARVLGDHALELLERRGVAGGEHRQRAQPVGRDGGALDDDGLREVLALEGVEAEAAAEAVDGARGDAVRDHVQPAPARGVDVGLDLLLGAVARRRSSRCRRGPAAPLRRRRRGSRRGRSGSRGADLAQHGEQLVVDVLVGRDLQHDALGVQRQR